MATLITGISGDLISVIVSSANIADTSLNDIHGILTIEAGPAT